MKVKMSRGKKIGTSKVAQVNNPVINKSIYLNAVATTILILAIFLISVIVRWPNMNRPLSSHHEWLTSTTLRTMEIWHDNGGATYNFNHIFTYNNDADRNINNEAFIKDAKGNYYYISYGPFAIIFPYVIFQLLHIYPSVLALQVFNLFVHLTGSIFIYLIILLLMGGTLKKPFNVPALIGFCVYTFTPETLWFHSNVYMSETFVVPLMIIGVFLFLKAITVERKNLYLTLLGLVIFASIYTEWLGAFFALCVFTYALLHIRKKGSLKMALVTAAASLLAVFVIIWQYSRINGFMYLMNHLFMKWDLNSGHSNGIDPTNESLNLKHDFFMFESWQKIFGHYMLGYSTILGLSLILGIILVLFLLTKKNTKGTGLTDHSLIHTTLYITFFSAILHHLALFHFTTAHDFSVLKTAPFISIAVAVLYSKIAYYANLKWHDGSNQIAKTLAFCLVLVALIFSVNRYLEINDNGNTSFMNLGKKIASMAKKDEVVFIKSKTYRYISPQFIYYAKRNIALLVDKKSPEYANDATVVDEKMAKELIAQNGASRGIVFDMDTNKVYYINQ